MISTSDRKKAMELIDETIHAGARLKPSCDECYEPFKIA